MIVSRDLPENICGFGDVEKAAKVFVRNELIPLEVKLMQLNDWFGAEIVKFDKYSLDLGYDD